VRKGPCNYGPRTVETEKPFDPDRNEIFFRKVSENEQKGWNPVTKVCNHQIETTIEKAALKPA